MTLIEWLLGLPYFFMGPQKKLDRTCKSLEKLSGVRLRSQKEAEAPVFPCLSFIADIHRSCVLLTNRSAIDTQPK